MLIGEKYVLTWPELWDACQLLRENYVQRARGAGDALRLAEIEKEFQEYQPPADSDEVTSFLIPRLVELKELASSVWNACPNAIRTSHPDPDIIEPNGYLT